MEGVKQYLGKIPENIDNETTNEIMENVVKTLESICV